MVVITMSDESKKNTIQKNPSEDVTAAFHENKSTDNKNTKPSVASKQEKHQLRIKDLSFSYLRSRQIFKDISFLAETSSPICLLGPNGCGKTTLLSCLIGLNQPTSGSISIDGKTTKAMTGVQIAKNLGFVPQMITASFDYKVIDYVVCGCAPHLKMFSRPGKEEYEQAWEALKIMQITHLAQKSYMRLSGGEQQQVCIARVLTQKANFILLDEPTSHLDFGNQIRVLKIIKEMSDAGFGLIMTTHNPDHALMMEGKTLMMRDCGKYMFGDTKDIVTEENLRNLYGIELYLEMSKNANRITCVAPSI